MIHNFHDSLKLSHSFSDAPWWEEVYRKAFIEFKEMTLIKEDGWHQRAGIDRIVKLNSGKEIYIDEKVRNKDYNDILLEIWSSFEDKKVGWALKDLHTDYIAYAFIPSKKCYLLPFQSLRRTLKLNGANWLSKSINQEDSFFYSKANNGTYTTVSLCVPIPILLESIKDSFCVNF